MSTNHVAVVSMINRVLETMYAKMVSGQFRFVEDVKSLQRQAEVAKSINQPVLSGWVLNSIGSAYAFAGELEPAEQWYCQALDLFKAAQDYKHVACILNNLGELRRMSGRLEEALAFYQQALAASNKANAEFEPGPTAITLLGIRCDIHLNLGIVYTHLGRFEVAWAMVEVARQMILEAMQADRSKNQQAGWVEVNRIFAEIALHQGQIDKAWSYITLADESAQGQDHYLYLADIALSKAHIASRDAAHPTPAMTYYSTAREYIKRLGHESYLARFLLAEAKYQHQAGAKDLAKTYASEAFALCTTLNMRDEATFAQTLME